MVRITDENRACRERMQRSMCREIRIRGTTLCSLVIIIVKIHAFLRQLVKVRRNSLTVDFFADEKVHIRFSLNDHHIFAFILAGQVIFHLKQLLMLIKPFLILIGLCLSQRRLGSQMVLTIAVNVVPVKSDQPGYIVQGHRPPVTDENAGCPRGRIIFNRSKGKNVADQEGQRAFGEAKQKAFSE